MQTTNKGVLHISETAIFSTLSNFENKTSGIVYNDGEFFLFRNYKNNGIVDYFIGGSTKFYGNATQWIQGYSISNFYDVFFDNTESNFLMEGSFSVNSGAFFQSGVVNNRDYGGLFLFEETGKVFYGSDYSHVNGPVKKVEMTDFSFPIGDGTFIRPAVLKFEEGTKVTVEAVYYSDNSASISPHTFKEEHIEFINDTEYWYIDAEEDTMESMLKLFWNNQTTAIPITESSPDKLSILHWDSASYRWVDKGGVVEVSDKSITTSINASGIYTFGTIKSNDLEDDIEIFNAVTPGSDQLNDYFRIEGIEKYPNNRVVVFNRWGVTVYEQERYDNTNVAFKGYSKGRATVNSDEPLPAGTYFYLIEFVGDSYPNKKKYSGYLYIH